MLYLALSSPTLPLSAVDDYAQTIISQRISMVSGVAQVMVYGSQKYAVRVQLNPRALASRGIGIDEVAAAVARANVNLPTGTLEGANQAFTIQSTGQLLDASAYRPIMMTTMAALLGTLPIAIGFGAGAESRRPLGLAVVGGLLFSQTLTLYVTPVVYLYMDGFQRKLGRLGIFQTRKKVI